MTFTEFFRRFFFHATLASVVWLVVACAAERVFPGVVAPFVNLPFIGLAVASAATYALHLSSARSLIGRAAGIVVLALCTIAAGLFVWSRVNEFGNSGILLIVIACVLSGLTIFALTVESS